MRRRRQQIKDVWLEQRMFLGRTVAAAIIVTVLALVVLTRLYYLQIANFEYFESLAHGNRVRIQAVPPTRGLIYDRDGRLLAENLPTYQLALVPEQVDDIEATLARLAGVVQLREEDLERFRRQLEQRRRFDAIPVRYLLSEEEVAHFAVWRHSFPGVDVHAVLGRRYPYGASTAHVLGYVGNLSLEDLRSADPVDYAGTTHIGKVGLERSFEEQLHGSVGNRQLLVNVQGRTLQVLDETLPVPGQDLHLELDMDLQLAAEAALGDFRGAVVALDPRDGAVRALVSRPSFDPNALVSGVDAAAFEALTADAHRPLFNRAIAGRYPPGSTIKPFLGLAGLELGAVDGHHETFCQGWYELEGDERRYRDWRREGHGDVDLEIAIAESCDVYFYELAVALGIDPMHDFLARFGFGRASGLDTQGEGVGINPSRAWKREQRDEIWYPGETVISGIGQGFWLVTPVQLAWSTAALANRGTLRQPRLVARIVDAVSGREAIAEGAAPETITLREPAHWDEVIEASAAVVEAPRGSAYAIRRSDLRIAGKTGTAQVVSISQDQEERLDPAEVAELERDHALFIAWAPVDRPTLVVAVVAEHGGGGGSVAAPMARAVLDAHFATSADAEVAP